MCPQILGAQVGAQALGLAATRPPHPWRGLILGAPTCVSVEGHLRGGDSRSSCRSKIRWVRT